MSISPWSPHVLLFPKDQLKKTEAFLSKSECENLLTRIKPIWIRELEKGGINRERAEKLAKKVVIGKGKLLNPIKGGPDVASYGVFVSTGKDQAENELPMRILFQFCQNYLKENAQFVLAYIRGSGAAIFSDSTSFYPFDFQYLPDNPSKEWTVPSFVVKYTTISPNTFENALEHVFPKEKGGKSRILPQPSSHASSSSTSKDPIGPRSFETDHPAVSSESTPSDRLLSGIPDDTSSSSLPKKSSTDHPAWSSEYISEILKMYSLAGEESSSSERVLPQPSSYSSSSSGEGLGKTDHPTVSSESTSSDSMLSSTSQDMSGSSLLIETSTDEATSVEPTQSAKGGKKKKKKIRRLR